MTQSDSHSDLLAQLRSGDEVAFESFVRHHAASMRAVTLRLLRNPADVDEVVQDAFLSLLRGLNDFRGDATLSTWLHQIVINQALMRLRSRSNSEEELSGEELTDEWLEDFAECGLFIEDQPCWSTGPLAGAIREELRVEVRASIDRLPSLNRTALVLSDMEGLSYEEIAQGLGISTNAAKLRVHRGRQALRALLQLKYGGPS